MEWRDFLVALGGMFVMFTVIWVLLWAMGLVK